MKYVYVVRGSEDGTLGVFTSMKKALSIALGYLNQNGDVKTFITFSKLEEGEWIILKTPADLEHVKMKLSKTSAVQIEVDGERTTAEIEEFGLNQRY